MLGSGGDGADLRGSEDAAVLVVDDAPVNCVRLRKILEDAGYRSVTAEVDPWKVADLVATLEPHAVLLDLEMPDLDGFGVLQLITKEVGPEIATRVLLMAVEITDELVDRAKRAGAFDVLSKPLIPAEVVLRTRNAIWSAQAERRQQTAFAELEALVRARTDELEATQVEILKRLALAAEYRDDDTGGHQQRVGEMSGRLAQTLGLSQAVADMIARAAPLHDVGKIGIPDIILLRPGRLDPEEMAVMRTHTTIGHRMVSGDHPLLWLAGEIALTHHERWDGSGYPRGLAGEDIPLPGRIVAVADVYDILLSNRRYRVAWSNQQASAEILGQSGRQFDPRVVDAFLSIAGDTVDRRVRRQARRG
jgi:putative two-component system response regulator